MPLVSQPALRVRQAPSQGKPSINDSGAPAGEEQGFYTSSDSAFEGDIAQGVDYNPGAFLCGLLEICFQCIEAARNAPSHRMKNALGNSLSIAGQADCIGAVSAVTD